MVEPLKTDLDEITSLGAQLNTRAGEIAQINSLPISHRPTRTTLTSSVRSRLISTPNQPSVDPPATTVAGRDTLF